MAGCSTCGGSRALHRAKIARGNAGLRAGSVPRAQTLEHRVVRIFNDGRIQKTNILRVLDYIKKRIDAGTFKGAELVGEAVLTKEELNSELSKRGIDLTF